jgi:hypothetical protein
MFFGRRWRVGFQTPFRFHLSVLKQELEPYDLELLPIIIIIIVIIIIIIIIIVIIVIIIICITT